MNGNGGYNALVEKKMMESIWKKMDDSERIAFTLVSMQSNNHRETMDALSSLSRQVEANKHSWLSDFGANVAGNAAFDLGVLLLKQLIRRI